MINFICLQITLTLKQRQPPPPPWPSLWIPSGWCILFKVFPLSLSGKQCSTSNWTSQTVNHSANETGFVSLILIGGSMAFECWRWFRHWDKAGTNWYLFIFLLLQFISKKALLRTIPLGHILQISPCQQRRWETICAVECKNLNSISTIKGHVKSYHNVLQLLLVWFLIRICVLVVVLRCFQRFCSEWSSQGAPIIVPVVAHLFLCISFLYL